ncbi:hypothetical protein [Thalassobellus suaedae]|uniref:3'-5' exoribonuclease n=1 Tax=Thalassobellus suaedae TaxID=3074124 RepID=A0ABY9XVS2_9FLAO|nr:3'-5' exoribonuclease [Flavobacteriaceae bacterium HL-DH14]
MKYFFDTEFLEGPQRDIIKGSLMRSLALLHGVVSIILFNKDTSLSIIVAACLILLMLLFFITSKYTKTKNTIDLISIGIVSEDSREYYAISKNFNLKEAWNRFQMKQVYGDMRNRYPEGVKEYWIRENVLKPIFDEFIQKEYECIQKMNRMGVPNSGEVKDKFTYKRFKKLLKKYGKSNKYIAEEIKEFVYCDGTRSMHRKPSEHNLYLKPKFYAYFADYDWVVFCWLFGKMIDLPKGFPKYCRDLKQMYDDREVDGIYDYPFSLKTLKDHKDYPKQDNEHNALDDAKWNLKLYKFLTNL